MSISIRMAVAACILSAGSAQAGSVASSAPQELQSVVQAMGQAAKVHDTDRFMLAYLHQPTLVFVINGEVIHGWDALRAQQLKWWHNGKTKAVYIPTVAKTEFMQLDPTTVVMTTPLAKRWTLPDGKVSTDTGVVTSVWKKLPEGWRIVYGHESWTPPQK